jgi:glycosyltransferase involved in cell wall biosynthesis
MYSISVIIPTYRRQSNLLKCLDSIETQSRQPEEVLIVNGDNNDDLEEFLKVNLKGNLRYRIIKSPTGLTRQRNAGIKNAHSDIILFVDDDVILDKDHVKEIVRVFERFPDNIGGVSGNVTVKTGFENRLFKRAYELYAKIFFYITKEAVDFCLQDLLRAASEKDVKT